jgi:hypothetical protein
VRLNSAFYEGEAVRRGSARRWFLLSASREETRMHPRSAVLLVPFLCLLFASTAFGLTGPISSVTVAGTSAGTRTGLYLIAGDLVSLAASGQVNTLPPASGNIASPNGNGFPPSTGAGSTSFLAQPPGRAAPSSSPMALNPAIWGPGPRSLLNAIRVCGPRGTSGES